MCGLAAADARFGVNACDAMHLTSLQPRVTTLKIRAGVLLGYHVSVQLAFPIRTGTRREYRKSFDVCGRSMMLETCESYTYTLHLPLTLKRRSINQSITSPHTSSIFSCVRVQVNPMIFRATFTSTSPDCSETLCEHSHDNGGTHLCLGPSDTLAIQSLWSLCICGSPQLKSNPLHLILIASDT